LQAALWDTIGQIDLLDTGLGNNAYMVAQSKDDIIKTPKRNLKNIVNTVTIEKILEDYNLDKIDAIIIELHERMKDGCCRAFYSNTISFAHEWSRGENIYLEHKKLNG
jgi:hypothetical protein